MPRRTADAEPKAIVGYVRVSTKEQAETKLSLTHQKQKIGEYGKLNDLDIAKIYNDEAESAKDLDRPEVAQLLEEVRRGRISRVIIYKLDRLTRSVGDLARLIELFESKAVVLSSVVESLDTSSASGRLVVNMIGVIAQWERETIAERTAAALSVKRSKNEKLGGRTPFGYKVVNRTLVPNPKETPVLLRILEERVASRGYQDIAFDLNASGVKPRTGRRWYASTIRAICLRDAKNPRPGTVSAGKAAKKGPRL